MVIDKICVTHLSLFLYLIDISSGSSIETRSSTFLKLLDLNFKTLYLEFIQLFYRVILL